MSTMGRHFLLVLLLCSWLPEHAMAAPPAQSAPDAGAGAEIKLHDTTVFRVLRAQGSKSATERARIAARALEHAVETQDVPEVQVRGDRHAVLVGGAVVIELDEQDALSASDSSLAATSSRVRSLAQAALEAERKRAGIAEMVFSISLVVFTALMSLFALRKLGELGDRARRFVEEHPDRIVGLRLQSLELIGAGPLRAALLLSAFVLRFVLQIMVLYVWLLVSLSQFEATRDYTHRLTRFLLDPLFSLAGRLLSALPLGLLALFFGLFVYLTQRFAQLFFENVRRGRSALPWLASDLVPTVSAIVRVGIVLGALVFAGPIVTGDPDGALAHAGLIVLGMLALAAVPLLAASVIGAVQVLSRRVRVGQELSMLGHRGRVTDVGLFDLRLRDEAGHDVRIPHLLSLLTTSSTHTGAPRVTVELVVSCASRPSASATVLTEAASRVGSNVRVELRDADASGARFAISADADGSLTESTLRSALVEALADAGIALGGGRVS